MDRFIEDGKPVNKLMKCFLKSNMDRFIGSLSTFVTNSYALLKSNMDRFIEFTLTQMRSDFFF